jgi:hypothetical protein
MAPPSADPTKRSSSPSRVTANATRPPLRAARTTGSCSPSARRTRSSKLTVTARSTPSISIVPAHSPWSRGASGRQMDSVNMITVISRQLMRAICRIAGKRQPNRDEPVGPWDEPAYRASLRSFSL